MPDSRRDNWLQQEAVILVFFLVCVGAALRIASLSDPLWLDELHTSWCVIDSLDKVADRARMGNQSPLYFWIDYLSFQGLGRDELALRLPSLLASIALLISIPVIVLRLSGSRLGAFLATTLAAIDDQFLFYAVEARPYAMVQLVAVWQVYCYLLCFVQDQQNRSNRVGNSKTNWQPLLAWSASTVFLFYLHYTTITLIATEILLLVFLTRSQSNQDRPGTSGQLTVIGLTLALCLPGLYELIGTGQSRQAWQNMISGNRYGLMMVAYFLIYLLPILLFGGWSRRGRISRSQSRQIGVLFLLASIPVAFCFVGSAAGQAPLAHYRYSIASSTVLIVLAGVACQLLDFRRISNATLVVGCVVGLAVITNPLFALWLQNGGMPQQRQERWMEVNKFVRNDNNPVVLCPNLVEDASEFARSDDPHWQRYYSFPVRGLYPITRNPDNPRIVLATFINGQEALLNDKELKLLIEPLPRNSRHFWLLVRAWPADADQIAENLRQTIQRQLPKTGEPKRFEVRLKRREQAPVALYEFRINNRSGQ